MTTTHLQFEDYDPIALQRLCGALDSNLHTLSHALNDTQISRRFDRFTFSGSLAHAARAALTALMDIVANSNYLYGMANGLIFAALGTATAAGVYLWYSQPSKQRPALIQAAPALLGLICLALS